MRVLYVEDDQHKARQVDEMLRSCIDDVHTTVAQSVNSGKRALAAGQFDLVVMDMSLPTFDIGPGEPGGRPQGFGGIEVIQFMERRDISIPVIVVTQFDRFGSGGDEMDLEDLESILRTEHGALFQGLVFFNSASTAWKRKLVGLIGGKE